MDDRFNPLDFAYPIPRCPKCKKFHVECIPIYNDDVPVEGDNLIHVERTRIIGYRCPECFITIIDLED